MALDFRVENYWKQKTKFAAKSKQCIQKLKAQMRKTTLP